MSAQLAQEYEGTLQRLWRENIAKQPPELQPADSIENCCLAKGDGFTCSLPKGHTGVHAAYGSLGYIHHKW